MTGRDGRACRHSRVGHPGKPSTASLRHLRLHGKIRFVAHAGLPQDGALGAVEGEDGHSALALHTHQQVVAGTGGQTRRATVGGEPVDEAEPGPAPDRNLPELTKISPVEGGQNDRVALPRDASNVVSRPRRRRLGQLLLHGLALLVRKVLMRAAGVTTVTTRESYRGCVPGSPGRRPRAPSR